MRKDEGMLNEYVKKEMLSSKKMSLLQRSFLAAKPFPHVVMKDFFVEPFVSEVIAGLRSEVFVHQESDLFSFMQTEDLEKSAHEKVQLFYRLLSSSEFKGFVQGITGLKVNGKVDCSAFVYHPGDYLLPHDDRLEGRRVAYTFHASTLSGRGGGALEFFEGAKKVVSIPPRRNTFILFWVKEGVTVHQVSEIVGDNERLSVAGWFND